MLCSSFTKLENLILNHLRKWRLGGLRRCANPPSYREGRRLAHNGQSSLTERWCANVVLTYFWGWRSRIENGGRNCLLGP
jgi:hypothetical protein